MAVTKTTDTKQPPNYLVNKLTPPKKTQEFYDKQSVKNLKFGQVWGVESHLRRRKFILEDHPQIAKLLAPTKPISMILAVILVFTNLTSLYMIRDASWPVCLLVLYLIGGTINHTLHVLVHDFTHYSGHPNILVNRAFGIFCNISMGIPSAISFGLYHSDHHNYMGQRDKDPDLPTNFEIKFFDNKILKALFFIFLSPIYALRPFLLMHKKMTPAEIINFIIIICSNLLVWKFWGFKAFASLLLGGVLSLGGHPAAIHVIAEHHQFVQGLETFDYIGPWNILNLNVGYHTQHHDFPNCPWYNLPTIRALAPEYYEKLPYHTSYLMCLKKFIFDDNINLFNRTIRLPDKKSE